MRAHVLSIDPGNDGGAALFAPGSKLVRSHQIKKREGLLRQAIVADAVERSLKAETDLIIMREKWQAGGKFATPRIMAGLGASWGWWEEQIRLEAPFLPSSRVLSVYPSTWRKAVLGAGATSSDGWARLTQNYVHSRFGVRLGNDEAVAVCIGVYAFGSKDARAAVQERPRWHAKARAHETLMKKYLAEVRRSRSLSEALAERALGAEGLEEA